MVTLTESSPKLNSLASTTAAQWGNVEKSTQTQYSKRRLKTLLEAGPVWTDVQQDQTYLQGTTPEQIFDDLVSKGFLYNGPAHLSATGGGNSTVHYFNNLVAVSSSQADNAQKPFYVRGAVQLEARLLADKKTMKTFSYTMNATEMEGVLAAAYSQSTLNVWRFIFGGSMCDGDGTPAVPNAGARLEWLLNSMVMIGAGGATLLTKAPPGSTQGCLAPRALVPPSVIAIFVVVAFIIVSLPLYVAFLFNQYIRFSSSQPRRLKDTPNGLVDWVAQAARESLRGGGGGGGAAAAAAYEPVKTQRLRHWAFGLLDETSPPKIFKRGDGGGSRGPYQAVGLGDMSGSDGHLKAYLARP